MRGEKPPNLKVERDSPGSDDGRTLDERPAAPPEAPGEQPSAFVEQQETGDSLIDAVIARASGAVGRPKLTDDEKRERRREYVREYSKRRRGKSAQGDVLPLLGDLLAAIGTWLLVQILGEIARPTEEQANAMAAPLARILMRHVPLTAHMTPDLLDITAFLVAASQYWSIVGDDVRQRQKAEREAREARASILASGAIQSEAAGAHLWTGEAVL